MYESTVGILPSELWHSICRLLKYEDLINVRLTSRGLSIIGAEHLVSNVRIQTSAASLERLACLANHPHLRKNIKHLTYEAALISDAGCIHNYSRHYETGSHATWKPMPPKSGASDRAKRLYQRNLDKFNNDIKRRFDKYQELLHMQQRLLEDNKSRDELFHCLASFPNLQSLTLETEPFCPHRLSKRFGEQFGGECAVPIEWAGSNSVWQLQNCFVNGLSSIVVKAVNPEFFDGHCGRNGLWLQNIFSSLKIIRITLRDSREYIPSDAGDILDDQGMLVKLRDGYLQRALGAAKQLQELLINFRLPLPTREASTIENVIGRNTWPDLTELDIDHLLCSSEDEFLDMLARQPKLAYLNIAFLRLERGKWTSATRRMREQLNLAGFLAQGMLDDEERPYRMDLCNRDAWMDEYQLTVTSMLDSYVTDKEMLVDGDEEEIDGEENVHQNYHPLYHIDDDYEEPEYLEAAFGPVSDSDDELLDSDDILGVHGGSVDFVGHHHHPHHDLISLISHDSDEDDDDISLDGDSIEMSSDDEDLPDLIPMDVD